MTLFSFFLYQTTKQSYKIIKQEEWTVIKLIKVLHGMGSFFGCPWQFKRMKIRLGTVMIRKSNDFKVKLN